MALNLIEIKDFPKTTTLAGSGEEIFPVSKGDGKTYGIKSSDLKAFLGTVQSTPPRPIAPSDPAPTLDGVYEPVVDGTYANAGGLVRDTAPGGVDEGMAVQFIKNGSVWVKNTYPLPQAINKIPEWDKLETPASEQRLWNGQIWIAINSTLEEPSELSMDWEPVIDRLLGSDLGLIVFEEGQNISRILVGSNFSSDSWVSGFLRNNGTIGESSAWYTTSDFQDILEGAYQSDLYLEGNASLLVYNSDFEIIQVVQNVGNPTNTAVWTLNVVKGARYFRTSKSSLNLDSYISSSSKKEYATDDVFITPAGMNNELEKAGFIKVPKNTNFIEELVGSDVLDNDLWLPGFLHYNGSIVQSPGWYHSANTYRVYKSEYHFKNYFSGNARCFVYDKFGNPVVEIKNEGTSYNFDDIVDVPNGELYFRLSFLKVEGSSTDNLLLSNNSEINVFVGESTIDVTNDVAQNNTTLGVTGKGVSEGIYNSIQAQIPTKTKFPIVTFISDDLHVANFEWYVPLVDTKNIKSTFAVITGRMDVNPNYATSSQVKQLYENGHDIGGHTHTHRQTGTLPLNEQELEVRNCKLSLLKLLGDNTPTFVAPFASRTPDTDRIIRQYFKNDFITVSDSQVDAGTAGNSPPIDTYLLKRVSFDASENGVSRLDLCKEAVDNAILNNEWVVFAVHPQYPEYSQTGNPDGWEQRRQELSDLIDYIKSKEVDILTAKDAFLFYKNLVELGNRRVDQNWYAVGMDGSREGVFFK